jgi:HrpA-like RNA helicase
MLPITEYKEKILTMAREARAMVITAETGAGKSTQVPQFLLSLLGDDDGQIIVTQPRRLAARAVAARVAEELGCPLGGLVGYRTAQEQCDSDETRLLFCTDGLQLVRELTGTGRARILVIDEVHEWNLNMEVLVAWACQRLQAGAGFSVVLMSATLEAEKLSQFFKCPVLHVPGRLYPVERRVSSRSIEEEVADLAKAGRNVLVFQPGKAEIEATIQKLRERQIDAEILPLHGQLEPAEQQLCFRAYDRPKVVVSTNVAQTSVTIPDIDAVVDSGMERRVEVVDGVEGLYLRPISEADCAQRAGRAGRCKPGVYVLCSNARRPEWSTAEIQRSRLDQLVLRLAIAGFDAEQLAFFHQPDPEAIRQAKAALRALGAIKEDGTVTHIGWQMSQLPVEVHYARMIIEASRRGVLDDVLSIVACLEAGGILDRSGLWRQFCPGEKDSDLLAQLAVFNRLRKNRDQKIDFREIGVYARAYFRALEIRQHLADALHRVRGIRFGSTGDRIQILKSCCSGLVDHLYGLYYGRYANGGGNSRELARESVVAKRSPMPDWVVAQPFDLEVRDRRGRTITLHLIKDVSVVDPRWLAEVAPHLVTVDHGNYSVGADGHVTCVRVVKFRGVDIVRETVPVEHPSEETARALASHFTDTWLRGEDGQRVNAELAELQAKSAGATRGPLSRDEILAIYTERMAGFLRVDDVRQNVDLTIPLDLFVPEQDAQYIREQSPDTVAIDGVSCRVLYKWQPPDTWSGRPGKQLVRVLLPLDVLQRVTQEQVTGLLPSRASYVLQVEGADYWDLSSESVDELRAQVESRRLDRAWHAFVNELRSEPIEVHPQEPLPPLPAPRVYDPQSGALAYPAVGRTSLRWVVTWHRSPEEAAQQLAKAQAKKERLDILERAREEWKQAQELLEQIPADRHEEYGLSRDEMGLGWCRDESLPGRLEQARQLLLERDRYGYTRTPDPEGALELIGAVQTRLLEALQHYETLSSRGIKFGGLQ